jgi:NAD-dependent SIR2 family protein deacetylase
MGIKEMYLNNNKQEQLKTLLQEAEAVLIGAGAGLSCAAGFTYSRERFDQHFKDFIDQYGFEDMYSGGFYAFETLEEHWAYWSRYVYINRYLDAPKPVYHKLFQLVKDKDYFVLTTNVDHCFQKAGFDKNRMFYTQGDYGLWQCVKPCRQYTYENEVQVKQMLLSQNIRLDENGDFDVRKQTDINRKVDSELLPVCPVCKEPMTMNLRADNTFVQDEGWYQHAGFYEEYLKEHQNKQIVFLELGVGYNTPGIIRYPFEQLTYQNPNAHLIRFNIDDPEGAKENRDKTISFTEDIADVLDNIVSVN